MHAINRDHLIQDAGGPTLNPPLTQVLPKEIVGGEQKIDLYPYDVAKAKTLLSEAGCPDGPGQGPLRTPPRGPRRTSRPCSRT